MYYLISSHIQQQDLVNNTTRHRDVFCCMANGKKKHTQNSANRHSRAIDYVKGESFFIRTMISTKKKCVSILYETLTNYPLYSRGGDYICNY